MSQIILIFLPLALPFYTVRFHIGSFPTTLLEITLLISLAWWIARIKNDGWQNSLQRIGKPLCTASVLWLIAGIISIFVASDHIAALGLWRAYFLEPVLAFIMLADLTRKNEDARLLLRSLAFATIVLALWAALQTYGLENIPAPWNAPPEGIRATSLFPFPNALALFCVPTAILFFTLLINRKKQLISPALAVLAFAAGIAATFFAKSDGGLIALCAAIFVALFALRKTRWLSIALVIISCVAVLAIPQVKQTLSDQIMFREWSGKVRLVMWDETVAMLRTRPILGAGLGAFPAAIAPYHAATWMEIFQYPHNILLNLWSETGLLGLFAFGWILLAWWRRGRLLALPIITAIIVHGIVDVPYFKNDLAVLFWILVVATLACTENGATHTFAICADRIDLEISENDRGDKIIEKGA